MSASNVVTATFPSARFATAAVDWFLNQAVDRAAIAVSVRQPGGAMRPPKPGDNRRTDLEWRVSFDVDKTRIAKRTAVETMRREGGTIVRGQAASA